jgi:hypothetical protein
MEKQLPPLRWREFFQDARGALSAFTVISLLAGFTLVSAPLVCRLFLWPQLSREETGSLTLLYLISALGDALLGIYLNKMPDTVALQTGANPVVNQSEPTPQG